MTFNKMTYKQLTGLALVIGLGLAVPTLTYLSQQVTRTAIDATTRLRGERVDLEEVTPFEPAQNPVITDVPFWYGREGDEVLIMGNQFGDRAGQVFVRGVEVIPTYWDNNNIHFIIESNTPAGDMIVRRFDENSVRWFGMLNVYENSTREEVNIEGNGIIFSGFAQGAIANIITDADMTALNAPVGAVNVEGNIVRRTYIINTDPFVITFENLDLMRLHNIYVEHEGRLVPFRLPLSVIDEQIGESDQYLPPGRFEIVE